MLVFVQQKCRLQFNQEMFDGIEVVEVDLSCGHFIWVRIGIGFWFWPWGETDFLGFFANF